MANQWLRLWHDMPNDPKFRVVAKASGQPLSLVMAVYVALLCDASQNKSRGVTTCHAEDLSVTVDCDVSQIEQIKGAMQGRLLDGDYLTGWEKRQPKREDSGDEETGAMSAAERKAAQRERERISNDNKVVTTSHDESRKVTLDKDKEEDKEKTSTPVVSELTPCPHQEIISIYSEHLPELPQVRKWDGKRATHLKARWVWVLSDLKSKGKACDKAAGLDFFCRMFDYIGKSDFLMGKTTAWSCPGLPWIVNDENFTKIIEGNYENKAAA